MQGFNDTELARRLTMRGHARWTGSETIGSSLSILFMLFPFHWAANIHYSSFFYSQCDHKFIQTPLWIHIKEPLCCHNSVWNVGRRVLENIPFISQVFSSFLCLLSSSAFSIIYSRGKKGALCVYFTLVYVRLVCLWAGVRVCDVLH